MLPTLKSVSRYNPCMFSKGMTTFATERTAVIIAEYTAKRTIIANNIENIATRVAPLCASYSVPRNINEFYMFNFNNLNNLYFLTISELV